MKNIEKNIGYKFKNRYLLEEALTHKSIISENNEFADKPSNQRMEYLGDAVIGLVSAELLYKQMEFADEGFLTKYRAEIVNSEALYSLGKRIEIGDFLILGKGEEKNGGRVKKSIIEDAVEALVAAIYLDSDYETVKEVIQPELFVNLDEVLKADKESNYKSALQEKLQKKGPINIEYRVMEDMGQDHDKTFVIGAYIEGKYKGKGIGKSKKEAEQNAAKDVLAKGK
ncbi:MAG: ribonuclease III [Anaerovoracaceae bacterium]